MARIAFETERRVGIVGSNGYTQFIGYFVEVGHYGDYYNLLFDADGNKVSDEQFRDIITETASWVKGKPGTPVVDDIELFHNGMVFVPLGESTVLPKKIVNYIDDAF